MTANLQKRLEKLEGSIGAREPQTSIMVWQDQEDPNLYHAPDGTTLTHEQVEEIGQAHYLLIMHGMKPGESPEPENSILVVEK